MMRALSALLFALTALAGLAVGAEKPFPAGSSSHPAVPGGLAFTVHVPADLAGTPAPLLVLLHERGFTDRDWADLSMLFAREGRYVVLCPRAGDLGFTDRDLDPLVQTVSKVAAHLSSESAHLLGIRDSARQALLFALARPKEFGSVVMLGADVPFVRPASAASSLRVLALKAPDDRPAAGRESVGRIREHVGVAEFRELTGDARMPDPGTRKYIIHFIDAAAGRATPGRDRSFEWRSLPAGLAERKQKGARALVYLFDDSPEGRRGTREIQNDLLFDHRLKDAARDVVPIMAHRREAGELAADLKLGPGPALIVLDEQGGILAVLQRRLTAGALLAVLRS
jgi:pimeloyl-ACP methyl ester carboxylesterase